MARAADISLSQADRSVLGPLAEHRFLTVTQLAVLLGAGAASTEARVERLLAAGLIRRHRIFEGLPAALSISGPGLRAVDAPMNAVPRMNLNQYRHEVGVGWLWLAARSGRFGELSALTAERRMRAADASASAAGELPLWGIGLGVLGRHGRPRRHYPDLMLDMSSGHRVAVELELSSKGDQRMRQIMGAYASDSRVDHVLYLVADRRIAGLVESAAQRAGLGERVHVQLLERDGIAGAEIGLVQGARRSRGAARAAAVNDGRPGVPGPRTRTGGEATGRAR